MSICSVTDSIDRSSSSRMSGSVALRTWTWSRSASDARTGTWMREAAFVVTDAWPASRRIPARVSSACAAIEALRSEARPEGSDPASSRNDVTASVPRSSHRCSSEPGVTRGATAVARDPRLPVVTAAFPTARIAATAVPTPTARGGGTPNAQAMPPAKPPMM